MEQEFFEAFGVEPRIWECNQSDLRGQSTFCKAYVTTGEYKCKYCIRGILNYPPITPEIVLKLITILVKKHCNLTLYWGLPKLTEQILKQCIKDSKDKEIQDQVRALFND